MKNTNWFDVDKKGLQELQAGKPKIYLVRELIQNGFDENVTFLKVNMRHEAPYAYISVEDDSPEGFKYLEDSFTLFRHTSKRENPNQRGRYNLGEKQVFSLCKEAKVKTTKGTVIFNSEGRTVNKRSVSESGSIIYITVKLSAKEFKELDGIRNYLPPKGIKYYVNDEQVEYKQPFKSFETKLTTEIQIDDALRKTTRKTTVDLHREDTPVIYEMGIPVCEIDCAYSIDVQQKVPLSTDRDNVSPAFLRDLYAEVLNNTYEDLTTENSSENWVRNGMSDDRVSDDAVKQVIVKRFGEKNCIANPNDPYSNDKAITGGYRTVYGSQMSGEEWDKVKRAGVMQSSSQIFKPNISTDGKLYPPNKNMKNIRAYYRALTKRLLGFDITVDFWEYPHLDRIADYSRETKTMRLFVKQLDKNFFDNISVEVDSLWIHEISHEFGFHTEDSFINACTDFGAKMKKLAIKSPEFFEAFTK